MSFKGISESGVLYAAVIIGLLIIVAMILVYLKKCWTHALNCGMEKSTLKSIVKSTITFSIVPSLTVVTGVIALAAMIGLPYSWLRLSVIGSPVYELLAANIALETLGVDVASADGYAYGLVMWAMAAGITVGILFNIVLCKKVHLSTLKLKEGDAKWGALSQTVFMSALIVALAVPMFASGLVAFLTFLTSMAVTFAVSLIAKKTKLKWLGGFSLIISLLSGMVASVLYTNLL